MSSYLNSGYRETQSARDSAAASRPPEGAQPRRQRRHFRAQRARAALAGGSAHPSHHHRGRCRARSCQAMSGAAPGRRRWARVSRLVSFSATHRLHWWVVPPARVVGAGPARGAGVRSEVGAARPLVRWASGPFGDTVRSLVKRPGSGGGGARGGQWSRLPGRWRWLRTS